MKIKQVIVSAYGAKVIAVGEDNKIYRWNDSAGEWELKIKPDVDFVALARTRYGIFKKLAKKALEWEQLAQADQENHVVAMKQTLQSAGLVKL